MALPSKSELELANTDLTSDLESKFPDNRFPKQFFSLWLSMRKSHSLKEGFDVDSKILPWLEAPDIYLILRLFQELRTGRKGVVAFNSSS